ncbi:hypothetical protein PVAG01_05351 [Phlyctema vagabunda]|uniref:Uncharacterized protein n=1 Tax=Phlyctema vagabunda TaxID=108571 RepID=A0ABR4PJS6_9HELO
MTSDGDREPRLAKPADRESSQDHEQDEYYQTSQRSKFRFKSSSKRRSHQEEEPRSSSHDGERPRRHHRHHHHHHHHHHRSKRRKPSPSVTQPPDDPSLYDDTYLPNASSKEYLDPDAAFRESLFDAMADDEGAQFWEGVYGQPIHTYPTVKETPQGDLERMTEEEYTAFVRAKMYEKTHQALLEEKARRDAAKEKAQKEREKLMREGRKERQEADKFRQKVEESLKRGEERRGRKAWEEKWEHYIKKWEGLARGGSKVAIASIPWPVESGRYKDVRLEEVERFFLNAPSAGQPSESEFGKILKLERVRWHPDKIQQKLGGQDVEEVVIQAVTAVFQVIDRMWSDLRGKQT